MEARSGGHEFYGDIFERASILLQTYAFDELMQGIAEGFSSIREKNRSTDYSSLNNKKGYVNLSDDSDSQLNEMLNKSTYFHTNVDCSEIATDFFNSIVM